MKKYRKLMLDIVEFDNLDVVTMSGNDEGTDDTATVSPNGKLLDDSDPTDSVVTEQQTGHSTEETETPLEDNPSQTGDDTGHQGDDDNIAGSDTTDDTISGDTTETVEDSADDEDTSGGEETIAVEEPSVEEETVPSDDTDTIEDTTDVVGE